MAAAGSSLNFVGRVFLFYQSGGAGFADFDRRVWTSGIGGDRSHQFRLPDRTEDAHFAQDLEFVFGDGHFEQSGSVWADRLGRNAD